MPQDRLGPFRVGDNQARDFTIDGDGNVTCSTIGPSGAGATDPETALQLRQGYIVLPDCPADTSTMEFGSICRNQATGTILIRDASGVREL